MANDLPWGANNESPGGPGGPGTSFCSPGGGFSGNRRSGKPLRLLPLKPPPGLQKPIPGPPGPPGDSLLAPQGRLLSVLEYKGLTRIYKKILSNVFPNFWDMGVGISDF